MSVGPSALSSLLVQRLDAVLGTQLAQQGNTRQNAVFQPGNPESLRQEQGGDGTDALQQIGNQDKASVKDAALQAELAFAARSRFVSTDTTASAPTSLGQTARTILTLLAQYPETAPALAGKTPLWLPGAAPAADDEPAAPHDNAPAAPAGKEGAQAAAQDGTRVAAVEGDTDAGQEGSLGQGKPQAADAGAAQEARNSTITGTQAARALAVDGQPGTAADAGRAQGSQGAATQAAGSAARTAEAQLAGPQPDQLAQALKLALQTSGLFYESHLSDVAYGRKPAGQMQDEPQARLDPGQAPQMDLSAPKQSLLVDNPRLNLPTTAAPSMPQADGMPSAGSAPTWSGSQPAHAPASPPGIHPEAALLVRQQLEVLANQTLAWEGTAWPGTDMWWEISRDPGDNPEASAKADAVSTWATRLVLTMPRLGPVEARLNLAGDQLVLQIVAPGSNTEIAHSADELRQRLQDAGLTLSNLTVSAHALAFDFEEVE